MKESSWWAHRSFIADGKAAVRPIREQTVELGEVSMTTDLEVVIMLAALLTMLAALVWWDGWAPVERNRVGHAAGDVDRRRRR
jgi:hypothetical protein